jgi:hypothetical protein
LIASENHIAKFLARKIYFAAMRKLSVKENVPNPYQAPPGAEITILEKRYE